MTDMTIGELCMSGRSVQDPSSGRPAPEVTEFSTDQAAVSLGQSQSVPSGTVTSHPSERLARVILLTVLCCFLVVDAINLTASPGPQKGLWIAAGITSICVQFTLQVLISSRAAAWPLALRAAILVAQAAVTYLPLLVLGQEWGGMAGWLAGSILLLVPGWTAWWLFSGVIVSMLAGSLILGLSPYTVAYLTVASLDTGLVVFALSRLARIIGYLKATRTDLAELAIMRERVRFGRDLHDLLGYSLSAITLKAELARQLVDGNPAQARDQLAELIDVARQAQADVRQVARGYRGMSLAKEAAAVVSLLSTAGIRTQFNVNCGILDEGGDTALATVLREAVTNMLRHSTAQNCTIEATNHNDTVTLRVVNDGVPPAAASRRSGSGLQNLAVRMAAVGGTISASCQGDRFEVLATVTRPSLTDSG